MLAPIPAPSAHLRYSGADPAVQRAALQAIIRAQPVLMRVLDGIRTLGLPDGMLVAGAIYNTVWNTLTGRPALTGLADIDIAYFDPSDLSYAAEDREIRRVQAHFSALPVRVELRNQARVHLWFPQKFGMPYPELRASAGMLDYFSSRAYAVGARLEADDSMTIFAPFGLDDMFSFRIAPNRALANKPTHDAKAARAKSVWPELEIAPW